MYRRRSTENGGHTFTMRLPNFPNQVKFDNQWVVPYSPLLSKTYKAHINVELCSSVKSIKYICKYVNKGSDLAIFEVQNINKNYEIARYQMGSNISSNEAIWHILSFPIHERDPAVQHLAIHLENGQRVYFTEENLLQEASEAPKTTLTEFFTLCQKPHVFGQFAKILVYHGWMFHVISHGTNPVINGSHGNKENHILPLQAYSKLRHWGNFTRYIQSNVSASIYVCYW